MNSAITLCILPRKCNVILNIDNVILPINKIKNSPSFQDGLDPETEMDLRILGSQLIQTSGILLKLPQVAMATGQVLFHRYYYAKSFVKYPAEITAMACIVLASKIEEMQRKIRDVINVFNHIKQVRNGKIFQPVILDCDYIALKQQVVTAEGRLLKELGFCCHIKHSHKIMIMYLRFLEAEKKLAQCAWNYINDALKTDVFVRFTPETIACSCIWLAGRQLKFPLPESPPWYHVFQATLPDIEEIAASILKLYARKKVTFEELVKVEKIRKKLQEERLRNKCKDKATSEECSTFSSSNSTTSEEGIPLKQEQSLGNGDLVTSEEGTSGKRAVAVGSRNKRKRSHERGRHGRSSNNSYKRSTSTSSSCRSRKKTKRSHSRSRSPARGRYQSRKKPSRASSPHQHRSSRDSDRRHPARSISRSPRRTFNRDDWRDSIRLYERCGNFDHEQYLRDYSYYGYENEMINYSKQYISRETIWDSRNYDNSYEKNYEFKENGRRRSPSRDRKYRR